VDDKFLETMKSMQEQPRPGYARALRERLRQLEEDEAPARAAWWQPALAGVAAVAAVVALLSLPSVRASAQQVLDMFRVRTFAVVQVNAAQLERLEKQKLDPQALLGGKVEKVLDGGKPQTFTDLHAAGAAAGFSPLVPRTLPMGFAADTMVVMGASESRVTVDTKNLRELLQTMAITDIRVPDGLDGQRVTLRTQTALGQRFVSGERHLFFLQSASPEISLPAGVDLARLGEVGLRLLGLESGEAHRMAQHIDWHSTMLVPLQPNATSFREVTVHGQRALLMESKESKPDAPAAGESGHHGEYRRHGRTVLWTEQGRVYALMGDVNEVDLMQAAESVR
jgi:hypothetical protein